jgi:lipopolysaccharide transport system ATP-binding protein
MSTVIVEELYKKFSSKLSDSVRSGIGEIVKPQNRRTTNSLLKSEFWALEDVSFRLEEGDSLGILGANGSGKTTLLRVLNGTYKPTRGSFEIKEPFGSLIAAGAGFSPTLTGRENIFLSAALLGLTTQEISKKYDSIVEFSELGDFLDMPLSHYSSGMSVRLGFAVATSVTPEVLLIDEVLAVGDIGFQRKCFGRIHELRKAGTTLLIVSHSTDSTWELCNKGLFMQDGKSSGIEDVKSVISKYVNSTISRKQGSQQETYNQYGDSAIRLNEISIWGKQGPNLEVFFRENLNLRIHFASLQEYGECFVRLNVSNDRYSPIATLDTSLHDGGISSLGIGEHKIEIVIDQVNLKPGSYFLDFSICDKRGGPHIGLFPKALQFEIHATPESHLYDFNLQALIDLPAKVVKFK